MKKIFLFIAFSIATTAIFAQSNAIGVRVGSGGEISAQFNGGPGRIEADLGLEIDQDINSASFTIAYHIVNQLVENANWYYGLGGTAAIASVNDEWKTSIGGVGVLGIEYNIKVLPVQVSLDWRPAVYIIKNNDIADIDLFGIGLGVRYTF